MEAFSELLEEINKTAYPEPRSPMHDHLTKMAIDRFVPYLKPGGLILDVGCGQGPAMIEFRNRGFDCLGIAMTKEDVDVCNSNGLNAFVGDMHELDFPWLDAIWARHVLEHSPAPFFVLKGRFHEMLAPGGMLYVEVPLPDTACRHEDNPNHFSVLGTRMWASLIRRAGFEIITAMELGFETPAGRDTYLSIIARKQ